MLKQFHLFDISKVILAILISWIVAAIFTAANVFPEGSEARTDTRAYVLRETAWVDFPYPCKYAVNSISTLGIMKPTSRHFLPLSEIIGLLMVSKKV